ncbi:PfkB family carbohydrate kinase [Caproiciproducens sp. R1]
MDATGAGDAFISSLVVFLAEGYSMAKSIEIATVVAGNSVTREGVRTA